VNGQCYLEQAQSEQEVAIAGIVGQLEVQQLVPERQHGGAGCETRRESSSYLET
jgi:hypothetical protein